MSIRVLNTRATIEDFYKGKIGEIIFEEWGEDTNFVIIDKQKLGEDIGRILCDEKETITSKNIEGAIEDTFDMLKADLRYYIEEYISLNYDGEFNEYKEY